MVIVVAAGAVIAVGVMNNGSNDKTGSIELTDSNGETKTYTYQGEKLSKICVVSSNGLEWCQILGMSDMVVASCTNALKENSIQGLFKAKDVGSYSKASAEAIADTGAQLVISPSKMGIGATLQSTLLNDYKIPTVILQCYGATMLQDAAALVKIAGGDAQSKLDGYMTDYNAVMKAVKESADASSTSAKVLSTTYSTTDTTMKFYIPTSEYGKILISLGTENALTADMLKVKNTTYATVSYEKVTELDENHGVDYIIIRTLSDDYDLDGVFDAFKDYIGSDYSNMNVVKANKVIAIDSDVASGCRDYIGQVLLCECLGYSIDYNAVDLVNAFNAKYGFNVEAYTALAYDGTNYLDFKA